MLKYFLLKLFMYEKTDIEERNGIKKTQEVSLHFVFLCSVRFPAELIYDLVIREIADETN